jgi:hypothetical protein
MRLIAPIRAALGHVRKVVEQSPSADRWKTLLDYIVARIIPRRPRERRGTGALLLGNCCFWGNCLFLQRLQPTSQRRLSNSVDRKQQGPESIRALLFHWIKLEADN